MEGVIVEINELLKKIDEQYEIGRKLKDKTRVSINNYSIHLEAAKYFANSVEFTNDILKFELDEELRFSLNIDMHYTEYEKYECVAHYYYEERQIDKALENISNSINCIDQSLELIRKIPETYSDKMKKHYILKLGKWGYFKKQSENKIFTFNARKELDSENYISALDYYKKSLSNLKELVEISKNLEPMYERVTKGNYIGMLQNISQTMSQIVLSNELIDGVHNHVSTVCAYKY